MCNRFDNEGFISEAIREHPLKLHDTYHPVPEDSRISRRASVGKYSQITPEHMESKHYRRQVLELPVPISWIIALPMKLQLPSQCLLRAGAFESRRIPHNIPPKAGFIINVIISKQVAVGSLPH